MWLLLLWLVMFMMQLLQLVLLLYILYRLSQDKNAAVGFCKSVWLQLQDDLFSKCSSQWFSTEKNE